jgi:hypothetical protein
VRLRPWKGVEGCSTPGRLAVSEDMTRYGSACVCVRSTAVHNAIDGDSPDIGTPVRKPSPTGRQPTRGCGAHLQCNLSLFDALTPPHKARRDDPPLRRRMYTSMRRCARALDGVRRALPAAPAVHKLHTVPRIRCYASHPSHIFAVGTMDTKGDELNYLAAGAYTRCSHIRST